MRYIIKLHANHLEANFSTFWFKPRKYNFRHRCILVSQLAAIATRCDL